VKQILSFVSVCLLSLPAIMTHAQSAPPVPIEGLEYATPYFPDADHDPNVTSPSALLGFREGTRPAFTGEIELVLRAWETQSDRLQVIEYARTWEGRPLHVAILSSPENMQNLDAIVAQRALLADQRHASAAQIRDAAALPTVAWLAYSIHGDETSGADAALNLIHHLASDRSPATVQLLKDLIICIDPTMNPDGRDRYLTQQRELQGATPELDPQSVISQGEWSAGRTNHYKFDLNRDWIFGVHPETRGRIRQVRRMNPLLFVDAHEMGPLDTYLFSPPRDPYNDDAMKWQQPWSETFAKEQAGAFDAHGWLYYTGEWNEGWYPGYSDAWAGFRGAIPILYEQAGVAPRGIKQRNGQVLSYRESVHHHIVSSLANLGSLQRHKDAITQEWVKARAASISAKSMWANRIFAVLPTDNHSRIDQFLDLMDLQGIEVMSASVAFTHEATDRFGRTVERQFPAGTLLIPNGQPNANLIAAMLRFDPRMATSFLERERRDILRGDGSLLYDITSWNTTMMFDLESFTIDADPKSLPMEALAVEEGLFGVDRDDAAWGYIINGLDDAAPAAAAQLMHRGVNVAVSTRPFTWQGTEYPRGSVVIRHNDNRLYEGSVTQEIDDVTRGLGIRAIATDTGFGPGSWNADGGGGYFSLLRMPQIAVASHSLVSANAFGETWHAIDQKLGIPFTRLDLERLQFNDLRRYNVIIIPNAFGSFASRIPALKQWVQEGGTLIAYAGSAVQLMGENGLAKTTRLRDAFEDIGPFEQQILREFDARQSTIEEDAMWSHSTADTAVYPWDGAPELPNAEEMTRRDGWDRLFSPQGAFVAARTDDRHYLTFGLSDELPVLVSGSSVFMSADGVEAPIRIGVYEDAPEPEPSADEEKDAAQEDSDSIEESESPSATRLGWSIVPVGHTLRVRTSGLLWPEASRRLANSAFVTRESIRNGQVILFSQQPAFRGATLASTRVLLNAIVFGPGVGARHPVVSP
jgi:zinc carboxypeptidase